MSEKKEEIKEANAEVKVSPNIYLAVIVLLLTLLVGNMYLSNDSYNRLDTKYQNAVTKNQEWQAYGHDMNETYQNMSEQLRAVASDANRFKELAGEFGNELINITCTSKNGQMERLSANYSVNCEMLRQTNQTIITKVNAQWEPEPTNQTSQLTQ